MSTPSSPRADEKLPEEELPEEELPEEERPSLEDEEQDARVERLGRYLLCFEMASGGMASIYLARAAGPAGFEKLVALKRIHPHLAKQKAFVDMFLDEARIASQINHPNVCPVFDFGEADGTYYIAMEFLMGESLSRVLRVLTRDAERRSSPKYPAIVARIIADACEGLHAAHELRDAQNQPLNVVHRDISPHNLFVTYDGAVRVVDFGIATAKNRLHETQSGEVKGKFAYMSPEQVRGMEVDRRADVWALGVVLWEALTVKRLFRRKTDSATILAVMSEPIPDPSEVCPELPPGLNAIVQRALSRDLDERYPTAREMGRDLVAWASKRRESVGLGDMADWMGDIFAESRARKRQLADLARQAQDVGPMQVLTVAEPSGLSELRGSEVRAITRGMLPMRRTPVILAGIAVVALLAFLGTMAFSWLGGEETDATTAVAAESEDTGSETPSTGGVQDEQSEAREASIEVSPAPAAPPPPDEPAPDAPVPATPVPDAPAESEPSELAETTTSPRAQRRRPRRGRVAGTGTLNVVTPGGWAYVELGGRRLGQTPLSVEVPAGRHTLRLLPFGEGPPRRVRVNVRPNGVSRTRVPLSP